MTVATYSILDYCMTHVFQIGLLGYAMIYGRVREFAIINCASLFAEIVLVALKTKARLTELINFNVLQMGPHASQHYSLNMLHWTHVTVIM